MDEGPDIGSEQGVLGIADVVAPLPPATEVVDGRTVNQTRYYDEFGEENVCDCNTARCFEDWVVANFGCNVCVGFVCDDFTGHTCNVCEEPQSAPGEMQFHGDGTRAL